MDSRRTYAFGTVALAAGAALFVLALSVVVVGAVGVTDETTTVDGAVRSVVTTLSGDAARLSGSARTLYVGVVGVGVSLWFLGIGLLLQGRAEEG